METVFLGRGWSSFSVCFPELLPSLQSKAQDLGSRKGLLPAGTPSSRASLQAFCMQYCWSSAAACETLILSTPASSLSCSTRRCRALTLAPADMATKAERDGPGWAEPQQSWVSPRGGETVAPAPLSSRWGRELSRRGRRSLRANPSGACAAKGRAP